MTPSTSRPSSTPRYGLLKGFGLSVGGRIVVLSYQSLEDRIVKSEFAARTSIDAPPDLPVVPQDMQPSFRLLTRGAEMASDAEVEANSRAASVRLRAVERVPA